MAADRLNTGDNQRMEDVRSKGVRTRNTMRINKDGLNLNGAADSIHLNPLQSPNQSEFGSILDKAILSQTFNFTLICAHMLMI